MSDVFASWFLFRDALNEEWDDTSMVAYVM